MRDPVYFCRWTRSTGLNNLYILVHYHEVLRAAEAVVRLLLEAYKRPPENATEVITRYANGETTLDPLREFTEACRQERGQLISTYGVGAFSS
jgi:hypothetical protein